MQIEATVQKMWDIKTAVSLLEPPSISVLWSIVTTLFSISVTTC